MGIKAEEISALIKKQIENSNLTLKLATSVQLSRLVTVSLVLMVSTTPWLENFLSSLMVSWVWLKTWKKTT